MASYAEPNFGIQFVFVDFKLKHRGQSSDSKNVTQVLGTLQQPEPKNMESMMKVANQIFEETQSSGVANLQSREDCCSSLLSIAYHLGYSCWTLR